MTTERAEAFIRLRGAEKVTMPFADAEFGPGSWTLNQWMGVGVYAVALLFLIMLVWRWAKPSRAAVEEKKDGR